MSPVKGLVGVGLGVSVSSFLVGAGEGFSECSGVGAFVGTTTALAGVVVV